MFINQLTIHCVDLALLKAVNGNDDVFECWEAHALDDIFGQMLSNHAVEQHHF
jgi:hypothetical protein